MPRQKTVTVLVTFSLDDEDDPLAEIYNLTTPQLPGDDAVAAALAHGTAAEALAEATGCEVHMELAPATKEPTA